MGISIYPIGLTDSQEEAFQSEGFQAAVHLTLGTASAVWRNAGLAWPDAKWYEEFDEEGFLPWFCGDYPVTAETVVALDSTVDLDSPKGGLHEAIGQAARCALVMGVGLTWS